MFWDSYLPHLCTDICIDAAYTYYKSLGKEHRAKSSGKYDETVVTKRRRERFNRVCQMYCLKIIKA